MKKKGIQVEISLNIFLRCMSAKKQHMGKVYFLRADVQNPTLG